MFSVCVSQGMNGYRDVAGYLSSGFGEGGRGGGGCQEMSWLVESYEYRSN